MSSGVCYEKAGCCMIDLEGACGLVGVAGEDLVALHGTLDGSLCADEELGFPAGKLLEM